MLVLIIKKDWSMGWIMAAQGTWFAGDKPSWYVRYSEYSVVFAPKHSEVTETELGVSVSVVPDGLFAKLGAEN